MKIKPLLYFIFFPAVCFGQKSQTIKINNSLVAISVEANVVSSTITTKEGDSKYYSEKTYSNGTKYIIGTGGGFSAGLNIEFHLTKNSRSVFLLAGAYYMQHGATLFETQGSSPSIFWTFYPRTTDPEREVEIQSVRAPVSVNQYFFTFGPKKNHSIGYQLGAYFDYQLSAKADDADITDAFEKFYITGFAGIKYRFGRLYAHADFTVLPSTKLFSEDYAFYGDSGGHYKENTQVIGLGFYLKK